MHTYIHTQPLGLGQKVKKPEILESSYVAYQIKWNGA